MVAWVSVVLVAAAQPPAAPSGEPSGHDSEFEAIAALMNAGRPQLAGKQLAELLASPARRDWALLHREALIEEARRIAFWSAYVVPAPAALTSGRLDEWVPRTGAIALTYRPDGLADFATVGDGALMHGLLFRGDYAMSLKGGCYPQTGPGLRLLVDATATASYCVAFGRAARQTSDGVRLQILRLQPRASEVVAETDSPLRGSAPYRVAVRVSAASVQVSVDGRLLLRADKRGADFGQVGLWPCEFSELQLSGRTSTAWFDALRDKHQQAAMQRFASQFDPATMLPPWLVAAPTTAIELPHYPCAVEPEQAEELNACVRLLERQDFDACLARTEARSAGLSPSLVMWLRALAFAGKREFAAALVCTQELLRRTPEFMRAEELQMRLLWGVGERLDALAKARVLVAKNPDYVDAVTALISFELCLGRQQAAATACATARARGLQSAEFERVARTLVKAERGPDWPRRFVHRAAHCEVTSDIDQRTCVEVANTLEEALATFTSEIGPLDRAVHSVRVFVFAGESSYRAYLADVIGTVPIHTTGLYSHALGQLLLWQTPERERMLQTVRHEGLHWYLEHLLPDPPRWLNEGLAQYYEGASARGERAGAGSLRTLRVAGLRAKSLVPLAEFVAYDDREFYADPARSYAQSWGLVTMLREGPQSHRALLTSLLAALARGQAANEAVRATMPAAKLETLDRDLRAWLDAQR